MSDEIYSITLTRFRRPSIIVCLPSPPNLRNRVYTCTNRANLHLIYFLLLFFYIYISKRLKIIFPSLIFIHRCKEKTFRRLALDERKLTFDTLIYLTR